MAGMIDTRRNAEKFQAVSDRVADAVACGLAEPRDEPITVAAATIGEARWLVGVVDKLVGGAAERLAADDHKRLGKLRGKYDALLSRYRKRVEENKFLAAPESLFEDMRWLVEAAEGLLAAQRDRKEKAKKEVGVGIDD